jgi:hypothetical protein
MDEENNYEIILNKFSKVNYCDKTIIIDKITKKNHIEIRKLLGNYNIVKPWDTNRACGKCNYFDIAEVRTNNIIKPNSKLVITRPTLEPGKNIVYVYQNWNDKYQELRERILDKGYYEGFQTNSRKIKGWFDDENVLRFGTKKTDSVFVELEKANLNNLFKRKYYFEDKETSQSMHLNYQGQLSALGAYLGYKSKLAKGEKNKTLYGINLNTVAYLRMEDLDINNLIEGKSKDQVDFIDVMWANQNGKIAAVFEVELKRVWKDVLMKFQALKISCPYGEDIHYIVVSDNPYLDYKNINDWLHSEMFIRDFKNCNIKYLSIEKLIEILLRRDKQKNNHNLIEEFFSESTLLDFIIDD